MDAVRAEVPAEDFRSRMSALPRGVWERRADTSLSTLSGGIRLAVFTSPFIVRWAAWLVALLIVTITKLPAANDRFEPWLLIGTFVQTLMVTFYVPVIRPVLLPAIGYDRERNGNSDVLWMGLADLGLSMIAVYLSGGWGSPYYHFALTALLIPSFFLTFRGVLMLGVAYTAAYVGGLMGFGDGVHGSWRDSNLNSFIGAIVTPLIVALVPNYLGSVLRELDAAREDAVDALGDSDLLFQAGRAFLEGGQERDAVATRVTATVLSASRFDAALLLVSDGAAAGAETRAFGMQLAPPEAQAIAGAVEGAGARTVIATTLPAPLDAAFAAYAWVAVAPLLSGETAEGWLIVATRERPAAILHEVRVLDALGGQIAIGLRNLRLAARIGDLAAEGERTRIAREIHDGIAQMVYMLSLSLETAIDRVGGDPEEQRERLRDLTSLAKHALWEVRQYIFDLRPLLSGEEGLVGAVQGQVKEFRAVSDLPVELRISGTPVPLPLTTSAELYRIVQEGLGNIFRHARASRVEIVLSFEGERVAMTIADDGVGIAEPAEGARVGFGMGNLRQRVADLHGTLDVRSAPGGGTHIAVSVPAGEEA